MRTTRAEQAIVNQQRENWICALCCSMQTANTTTEPNSVGGLNSAALGKDFFFFSTHQWALCSLCPGPYFWVRWPRHTPLCRCLSSVTPPGWEGLSLCGQQRGCTPTTGREKVRVRNLHGQQWATDGIFRPYAYCRENESKNNLWYT